MGAFDLSFKRFITPAYARGFYLSALIWASLQALGLAGVGVWQISEFLKEQAIGYSHSEMLFIGIGLIIAAPIVFVWNVIVSRVTIELLVVIFRIEEHLRPASDQS